MREPLTTRTLWTDLPLESRRVRPSPNFKVKIGLIPIHTPFFPSEDTQHFPLIHLNPCVRLLFS